jgi:tetratricopeptide (TPR) repeat protein
MTLLGCLVLWTTPHAGRRGLALPALAAVLLLAAMPLVANRVIVLAGGMPLSPEEALERADLMAAEGDGTTAEALALVRHAIDRAPVSREAHEQLAMLVDGPEAEAALRVALRIEPWASLTRDALALDLWRRGERAAAAVELEESIARAPELERHGFLSPELVPEAPGHEQILRALAEGDTLPVRLSMLPPELAEAIDRGLARAMDAVPWGPPRAAIVASRVTLLEAHQRWAQAARLQQAESLADPSDLAGLPRAARNFLEAGEAATAEETLLAALLRTPERGELYRRLAVDVYAARGDYASAEQVLAGGERNAVDRMPVYDAVTTVIAGREAAWAESLLAPLAVRAEAGK